MKELKITTNIRVYILDECSEIEKILISKAKEACKKAYTPYSKFNVGAAVLLDGDKIITGNNQENAAYPSGICAERTAVFYANSKYPNKKILKIVVAAYYKGEFIKEVAAPCGSCRQVLLESENRFNSDIEILLCCAKDNSIYKFNSVKDILPLSFGDEFLK